MVCQEDIFEYFVELSRKLESEGYPILDNIIHEFPGFLTYDEIMEDDEFDRELES